jgi:putative Mg2+ transporter-C (MgtC) family protein
MDGWALEEVLPVLGAALAGGLIGLEREYRGRPAGLRTHVLVCLSSGLLMVAAVHQYRWMTDTPHEAIRIDPVRMAHGILTGIGFLCGGVIFRDGLSVHGLTTAASLWITAALGILFGVADYDLAIGGTALTLLVLVGFRWLDEVLPQRRQLDVVVRWRREEALSEDEFRALAAAFGLKPGRISHRLLRDGAVREISTTLTGLVRGKATALADRLCAESQVLEFEISTRND